MIENPSAALRPSDAPYLPLLQQAEGGDIPDIGDSPREQTDDEQCPAIPAVRLWERVGRDGSTFLSGVWAGVRRPTRQEKQDDSDSKDD